MIDNVQVYGLENAMRVCRFPMIADIEKYNLSNEAINYWLNQEEFLKDFSEYQKNYNKPIGEDTSTSCYFCGSSDKIQRNNKIGHYVCSKHLKQAIRYGDCFEKRPKFDIYDDRVECTIYGNQQKESTVIIDAIDVPLFFYAQSLNVCDGYIRIHPQNDDNIYQYHRLILDADENYQVDHINGNPYDNRRCNLRLCNSQENIRNRRNLSTNKSGVIGVSWSNEKNKWRSHIMINKKQKFLGYYSNKEDAIVARLLAEKEFFKEFAPQQDLFEEYGIEPLQYKTDTNDYNKCFNQILKSYNVSHKLANTAIGEAHDNFEVSIIVQFDLTFTVKAWAEAERYHFFDIVSSQSTMHRIAKMDYDKCFCEYVTNNTKAEMERLRAIYNADPTTENYLALLYNCPTGLKLTAGITTNYRQLKTIYKQRKTHRLKEWRDFCDWIETLPFSDLITGDNNVTTP